jgi:hypothetical protein
MTLIAALGRGFRKESLCRLPMSALGQKQTLDRRTLMSALPPKADIAGRQLDVFVPDKVLLL